MRDIGIEHKPFQEYPVDLERCGMIIIIIIRLALQGILYKIIVACV